MSESDSGIGSKVTKALASVVGAAAAIPATHAFGPVGGKAAGIAAAQGVEIAGRAYTEFRNRRAEEWWRMFVARVGFVGDEEAVTEAKLQAESDPQFQERVYHALNAVWAAVDDSVLPHLAYLAADYEASRKPADVSYKRLARFLQETRAEELVMLQKLGDVVRSAFDSHTLRVDVNVQRGNSVAEVKTAENKEFGKYEIGMGLDVLLRRLRDEYLVDEGNIIGDYIGTVLRPPQFELLSRYLVRPLV